MVDDAAYVIHKTDPSSSVMSVEGGHQELATASTGHSLSAPSYDPAGATTDYALITGGNNIQPPSHHTTHQNGIPSKSSHNSARVDISAFFEPPSYLQIGRIEGFILSKHCLSPAHHLYHRFQDFPIWNRASPVKPLEPASILISSIDDELWIDFSHAFSNDLKVGDRNLHIFQCIAGTTIVTLMIIQDGIDRALGLLLIVMFAIMYERLRPSLFDKVDKTAAKFQNWFAEKGLRVSVVHYSVEKGKLTASSRYIVFTALPVPHPLALNLV